MSNKINNIYIIGCKGIPAKYGGFETFVDNLVTRRIDESIKYHVACMSNSNQYEYNGADCFCINSPIDSPLGRLINVSKALKKVLLDNKDNYDKKIIYILGCRIGPILSFYRKRIKKINATIMCNPDGLEWKRDKWNYLEKKIIRFCERCLVENSDVVICDSKSIEDYIKQKYRNKTTKYIAYGAEVEKSKCEEEIFDKWKNNNHISTNGYYLVVGRFVPENNLETIINEFCKSETKKDLVVVSNVEKNEFYNQLVKNTEMVNDKRVKLVGTVYDQQLLYRIREEAYGYIHGHEVGGTNPSLLESLAHTNINLLLDVNFNKEVACENALYWNKNSGSLKTLINNCENFDKNCIETFGNNCKKRIKDNYNWKTICSDYEELFKCYYE